MENSSSRDHLMDSSSSSTSPLPNHHTKPITNHKIPESVTRPVNNSTNHHLHNDDITTTTTSIEEHTTGKPKACEMSDPVTGEVLQTFRSCSEAERITKISRATIGKGKNSSFFFPSLIQNMYFLKNNVSSHYIHILATQKIINK